MDRRPAQGSDSVVADATDPEAITPAFRGVDTVVDLAAASEMYTPWGPVYANNIPSTYNVLEAAKQAGVRRVVFASSNHVTGLYENDPPYSDVVGGPVRGPRPGNTAQDNRGHADTAGWAVRHREGLWRGFRALFFRVLWPVGDLSQDRLGGAREPAL